MIDQLIEFQHEKASFLKAYLDANEMSVARAGEGNFTAIKELSEKKQSLATSIDVVDDKIISGIERLKESLGVEDLSEVDALVHPEIKVLKAEAAKVLKLMVEAKASDERTTAAVDEAFEQLKTSVRHIDKNKLYYYTKKYFDVE
jgi:ribosome-associated translation inhibitor RaiA